MCFHRHITTKFCEDQSFKIMDLKPELMAELETYKFPVKSEVKFRIPMKFKEHEIDGLDWACGYIARRMKYVQPLGTVIQFHHIATEI